jgi:uncharacterized protein (DUF58 family)
VSTVDFLPPHLLERLGGLELIARRVVAGVVAGRHRALRTGAGEEFARHREYRPGDDLRALDWRLYGRTDRLYVREYRADSNLRAYLVLDDSPSMNYADAQGVTKLRYAAYLAAALAHLMLRAGDRVGVASYGAGGEVRLQLPPSGRGGWLQEVVGVLEGMSRGDAETRRGGAEGQGASSMGGVAAALDRVGEALGGRGRVVLISDLLEEDEGEGLLGAVGRLRARGDEVVVLRPLTPAELGEGAPGAGRYHDPEMPGREIDADPAGDAGYRGRVAAYYGRLHAVLRELGAEYVACSTELPVEVVLGEWLGGERLGRDR